MISLKTINRIANMTKKYDGKYDYVGGSYDNVLTKTDVYCNDHEKKFTTCYRDHYTGNKRCEECEDEQKHHEDEIRLEHIKRIVYDKFENNIIVLGYYRGDQYDQAQIFYKLECQICKSAGRECIKNTTRIRIIAGSCCNYCGRRRTILSKIDTREQFIEKAVKVHGEKYNYDNVVYITDKLKVKIFCIKCKEDFDQTPSSHKAGNGCKKCWDEVNANGNGRRKSDDDFIKQAIAVHGNKYGLNNLNYCGNKKNINIFCLKCASWFTRKACNFLDGCGCSCVSASIGELAIMKFLDDKSIKYESEKRFKDCKGILMLPFDIYIESENLLIEFDGKQHFESIPYYGGMAGLLKRQYYDGIKNEYAFKNKINLIRIKYDQSVNEVLTNYFTNKQGLFDFEKFYENCGTIDNLKDKYVEYIEYENEYAEFENSLKKYCNVLKIDNDKSYCENTKKTFYKQIEKSIELGEDKLKVVKNTIKVIDALTDASKFELTDEFIELIVASHEMCE